MKEQKENTQKLSFVRVIDPAILQLIPRYLFEQIKDFDSDAINRLYEYGVSILTQVVPNEQGQLIRIPNALVHIAVLVDDGHKIKGFLWLEFDLVEQSTFIRHFLVSSEKQSNGMLKQVQDYIHNLPIGLGFKSKIKMSSVKPEELEKSGWKKVETIMEIRKEKENGLLLKAEHKIKSC